MPRIKVIKLPNTSHFLSMFDTLNELVQIKSFLKDLSVVCKGRFSQQVEDGIFVDIAK